MVEDLTARVRAALLERPPLSQPHQSVSQWEIDRYARLF